MKFNPNIHHRKSIRLDGYDYSQAGVYFITICNHERECRFGRIVESTSILTESILELNEFGIIAQNEWIKLEQRFLNFELDVFQIMPNHIHAIVVLRDIAQSVAAKVGPKDALRNVRLGDIIGAYKSLVSNQCLIACKSRNESMGKLWQRNFHEHIIRDERSYKKIAEYIIQNPANWKEDRFYKP